MCKGMFLALLLLVVLPSVSQATEPFQPLPKMFGYELGSHMEMFVDKSSTLTIDEVVIRSNDFKPLSSPHPSMGFLNGRVWLKLHVVNPTDRPITWILEDRVMYQEEVDFYRPNGKDGYSVVSVGVSRPFNNREIEHNLPAFEQTEPPHSQATYYLSMKTGVAMVVLVQAFDTASFRKHIMQEYAWHGGYFCIILVMLVYNLFLYVSIRDASYFHYVMFLVFTVITQFSFYDFAHWFIWPEMTETNPKTVIVAVCLGYFFALRFCRSFLKTKETMSRIDRILVVFEYAALIIASVSLFIPLSLSGRLTDVLLILLLGLLAVGIHAWRNGFRAARFYVLAWMTLIFSLVTFGLMNLGLMEGSMIHYNLYRIGSLLETILLSLALADRINIMRIEKSIAKNEALRQEIRIQETLRRAKEELEVKVEERTTDLKTAKEKAEAATKLKDQFVSLVSHDLRSPLSGVSGMLGLVNDKDFDIDWDETRVIVARSKNSVDGLITLISRLLDIGRLQTGQIAPNKRFINLKDLVDEYLLRLTFLAEEKSITLVNEIPASQKVFADHDLLGEVVHNLVSNAVKFCHSGEAIFIREAEGGFTVIDTGSGVPKNIRENLFEHAIKTSTQGTAGEVGTGLGLPYCADIIKAHGGQLTLKPNDGKGSQFIASLPEIEAIVLVVDDQPAYREIIKETIQSFSKAEIMQANNGLEALNLLQEISPHLIITDIEMPECDGLQLLERIRSDPSLRDIPVIINTSIESSVAHDGSVIDLRKRAFAMGADDFTLKPVVPEDFIPRVNRFI